MTPSNEGIEPTVVAADVAGAQAPATPNSAADVGNEPAPLSAAEMAAEFAPTPEPQQVATPEQSRLQQIERDAHALRYKVAETNALKRIEKGLSEGKDAEEIIDEMNLKDEGLKNRLLKIAAGEELDGAKDKEVDIETRIQMGIQAHTQKEMAKSQLMQAIAEAGLNVKTQQAAAARKALIADYNRLEKSLPPQEATKFALYNAGITTKAAMDEGFQSGFQQGAMVVPPAGVYAGNPYRGNPQTGEMTPEKMASMSFEQMRAWEDGIKTQVKQANAAVTPRQGNPRLR